MNLISFEDGARLHEFMDSSGYALETLQGELGMTDIASFRLRKYILSRTKEPTARNTLVHWFTGGLSVNAADAQSTIPAWALELFERSGLLVRNGDAWVPTAMILPMGDLLIASDRVSKIEEDPTDLVIWPNATTQQLLNGTIRKPIGSALDLGCGTGVQALVTAEHAQVVVATDVNARAAEFTDFNARLNGIRNVEALTGDCFEPVAGRKFDLIVSNPPFFITRSSGIMYCENPMELDLFLRRLLREAPEFLNEGGFFHILCEWVELEGQPWRERIGGWLEGSGCDAWAIKTYSMTPLTYGKTRGGQRPGTQDQVDSALADWVEYYREKKIAAVHGGFITMRRRSGTNWIRLDEDPAVTLGKPVADHILAGFEARDLIESSDERLLSAKLKINPNSRLVQTARHDGTRWVPESLAASLPGVFARELELDPLVADFAGKFDGNRSLGELVQELAKRVNADPETVARETLAVTRKLLDRGFLALA